MSKKPCKKAPKGLNISTLWSIQMSPNFEEKSEPPMTMTMWPKLEALMTLE